MPDVRVSVDIRRPPDVVRKWWTEFPPLYENAKEQPHRIVTRARDASHIDTLTYWRAPLGRELEVPERFTLRPQRLRREDQDASADASGADGGWDVDIVLPFGLAQRDVFTLTPTPEGTQVRIDVDIWPRSTSGRLALPFFRAYARRNYPRTWRAAARWCEKATPEHA